MRRVAALLAAVLLAAPAWGKPAKPRLAVIVIVDGLSWETLSRWRPWMHAGLARLMEEGAVASDCRYPHLNTLTGPGHASVATGEPPSVHGIAANEWFVPKADGSGMEEVYSASQPPAGAGDGASFLRGPGRMRVATLGDRLVGRNARSKVVAISNKDRAAIFLAGRDRRHAAYWYSETAGTYVTSGAYDATSPAGAGAAAVVARFNAEKAGAALQSHLGTVWTRLPGGVPPGAPEPEGDVQPFQDPTVGSSFPHDLTTAREPHPTAIQWTSLSDRLLVELAIDLLGDDRLALGKDDAPDLLGISFSATDFASHDYGPESVEALEVLRSLDLDLGRLLDALSRRVGVRHVMVAFSADHGFLPLRQAAARRVLRATMLAQLNAAVNAALGRASGPPLLDRFEACSLWLDRAALARPGSPSARDVLEIVRRELATTWKDAVEANYVEGEGSVEARNAYVPGRSGDLFVVPRRGVLLSTTELGTSHGSPWPYDTHVPLIFWGGGTRSNVVTSPRTPYDVAPTLASWLRLK